LVCATFAVRLLEGIARHNRFAWREFGRLRRFGRRFWRQGHAAEFGARFERALIHCWNFVFVHNG
jgi:hypothetical protein